MTQATVKGFASFADLLRRAKVKHEITSNPEELNRWARVQTLKPLPDKVLKSMHSLAAVKNVDVDITPSGEGHLITLYKTAMRNRVQPRASTAARDIPRVQGRVMRKPAREEFG